MNATATIFALALASNFQSEQHFQTALTQLAQYGELTCSSVYLIPCREGKGADYWNAACLWRSHLSLDEVQRLIQQMEIDAGRVRPSHQISLDIDLIAWGKHLSNMQFNVKKCPLALDVKVPLAELWQHPMLADASVIQYPTITTTRSLLKRRI